MNLLLEVLQAWGKNSHLKVIFVWLLVCKILIRIANNKDLDQTATLDLFLYCPFSKL